MTPAMPDRPGEIGSKIVIDKPKGQE